MGDERNWSAWSGTNNDSYGRHDGAAKYIRAWRRIHDIFEREGATNVSWVWAPNGESIPDVYWNRVSAFYPGDRYVDWVGLSAYNFGTTRYWSHWSSFAEIVRPIYRAYSARKPIMVAETASTTNGGNQSRWISAVLDGSACPVSADQGGRVVRAPSGMVGALVHALTFGVPRRRRGEPVQSRAERRLVRQLTKTTGPGPASGVAESLRAAKRTSTSSQNRKNVLLLTAVPPGVVTDHL